MRNERGASGAQDACRGVGCAKSGLHSLCRWQKKVDAQMPWGALSVARRLPPTESVFRGRGISSSVSGCHSRKYIHIRIYEHIHTYTCKCHHIRSYTYIYVFIDLGRLYTPFIHAYTYIYLHIHTYTCIYILIHTFTYIGESQSRGVFEGVQPTPSGIWMDSNRPDLLCQAMGLDYSARIVHWRPPCETRGALQGPRTRAAGWGAPNRVCTTFADG